MNQPRPLLLVEGGVHVHAVERPTLATRVHPQRDRSARTQAPEQQFHGLETGIGAALVRGLVGPDDMSAGLDRGWKVGRPEGDGHGSRLHGVRIHGPAHEKSAAPGAGRSAGAKAPAAHEKVEPSRRRVGALTRPTGARFRIPSTCPSNSAHARPQ